MRNVCGCVCVCVCVCVLVAQTCLTLSKPMNCTSLGPDIYGILQARILEWVTIPFSKGFPQTQGVKPGLLHCRQILDRLSHQGSRVGDIGSIPDLG